jgi:ABC-type nitrate/sulfonate/bicarbonate transport system substrate-binding protein
MRKLRRLGILVMVVMVVALVASACSDDSTSATPAPQVATVTSIFTVTETSIVEVEVPGETVTVTSIVEVTAAPPATSAPLEPATVNVATFSEALNYWCFYAALDHGFFDEQAIVIPDPIVFRSDAEIGAAIFSGSVDIALGGATLLVPVEQGLVDGLTIIASVGNLMFSIIAPAETASFEDLRGKTFIVQPEGASAALYTEKILELALGEGNFELLHVGGGTPARVAALEAGLGDATVTNVPSSEKIEAEGTYRIIVRTERASENQHETGGAYAMREWLDANPDVANRFMKAWVAGCNFIADPANRGEVELDLRSRFGMEPNIAAIVYDEYTDPVYRNGEARIDRANFQNLVDIMIDGGILDGSLDLDSVIDDSFVDAAE